MSAAGELPYEIYQRGDTYDGPWVKASDAANLAAKLAEAERERYTWAEAVKRINELTDRAERAEAECATLRALLSDAADEIEAWGAYASDYFQDKHDLDGNVKRFRDAARRGETP